MTITRLGIRVLSILCALTAPIWIIPYLMGRVVWEGILDMESRLRDRIDG